MSTVTKKSKLIAYLKSHRRGITGQEALRNLGLYRLSGEIHQLRKAGYHIVTSMETDIDEYGNEVTYARYYLGRETNEKPVI